eukprot:325547-Chlamydomonas_euryale.AAC.6
MTAQSRQPRHLIRSGGRRKRTSGRRRLQSLSSQARSPPGWPCPPASSLAQKMRSWLRLRVGRREAARTRAKTELKRASVWAVHPRARRV